MYAIDTQNSSFLYSKIVLPVNFTEASFQNKIRYGLVVFCIRSQILSSLRINKIWKSEFFDYKGGGGNPLKFQNRVKIKYLYNQIFANYPFLNIFLGYENVLNLVKFSFGIMFIYPLIFQKRNYIKNSSHKLLFLKYVTYRFYHFSDFL